MTTQALLLAVIANWALVALHAIVFASVLTRRRHERAAARARFERILAAAAGDTHTFSVNGQRRR